MSTTIKPRELIVGDDTEPMLALFAATLRLAEKAKAESTETIFIPPGPFWFLFEKKSPTREQLLACLGGAIPAEWPRWFQETGPHLAAHRLGKVFLQCVEEGPDRGVSSPGDLCRLLGAVSQTLYSTNSKLVRSNLNLAAREPVPPPPSPPPPQPEAWTNPNLFVSQRPDEDGGFVAAGAASLWMASYIGPNYADKVENQDAVFATGCGDGLCFALADGISSSLGARYAAAWVAHRFCREVRDACQISCPESESLVAAARNTQAAMDQLLEGLRSDPGGADRLAVLQGSRLNAITTEAVLANTQTGEKDHLQPALATTLIGGYLRPGDHDGEFVCGVICIGDGAVEVIRQDGGILQILATDPDQTGIDEWMGPGVLSRKALQGPAPRLHSVCLQSGQYLLVTSDGLARGHQEPVWSKVSELTGDVRSRFRSGSQNSAAVLLRDLATAAERFPDGDGLFNDNLSLILVAAT